MSLSANHVNYIVSLTNTTLSHHLFIRSTKLWNALPHACYILHQIHQKFKTYIHLKYILYDLY